MNDTIDFVKSVLITEVNSGTDNPVSFTLNGLFIEIKCTILE